MTLVAMADNDVSIPVRRDASLYDALAGYQSYVLKNIDNELAVNYGTGTLKVTLSTGGCVICGRHVFNTSNDDVSLTLPADDTGYIVVRYDLTQAVGNEAQFLAVSALETGNVNTTGTKHDLVLGRYVTGSTGVTNYTDMRDFNASAFAKITVTLTADGWSEEAPYTQTVSGAFVADTDYGMYIAFTGTQETDEANQDAMQCISGGVNSEGSCTFVCYDSKPDTDITVNLVRKGV